MNDAMTRRDFLSGAAVFSFVLTELPNLTRLCAGAEPMVVAEVPVIWMATGACSGCSIALMNSASPTIQELLLKQVLPGKHVSLGFHTTLMAASGEPALEAMDRIAHENPGGFVLVIDGATSAGEGGAYCSIGEIDGRPITGYEHVCTLGRQAMAVIAIGQCAAFGGIPAAGPNPTGCVSVEEIFEAEEIATPLVHIPGCPPHPDWIVGTIAALLVGGLDALELDDQRRPAPYFKKCLHDQCHLRGFFENGDFAENFGDDGCLLKLGCKGPITDADCPVRKFNNGTSWCCEAGHPCIGCCHRDFPFERTMFAPIQPDQLGFPEVFPAAHRTEPPGTEPYVAVGLIGAGAFLAGVGATVAARKLRAEQKDDDALAIPNAEVPDA